MVAAIARVGAPADGPVAGLVDGTVATVADGGSVDGEVGTVGTVGTVGEVGLFLASAGAVADGKKIVICDCSTSAALQAASASAIARVNAVVFIASIFPANFAGASSPPKIFRVIS